VSTYGKNSAYVTNASKCFALTGAKRQQYCDDQSLNEEDEVNG